MSEILGTQRENITTDALKDTEWRKEQITAINTLEGVLRNGEVIFSTAKADEEGDEYEV